MKNESGQFLLKRLVNAALLLGTLCLLPVGFYVYLGYGRLISHGNFEVKLRDDSQWSYQKANAVGFSASGVILRTGETHCIGPFRITHWRDWRVK